MFRLPTHLESLVPPPRDQLPQSPPWRGSIFLPASSPHPAARPREIRVTAAEIENDNRQEKWPTYFHLHIIRREGVLREVHAWLAQVQREGQLARCMLMPDRLPEQAPSRENQALFESFAYQLLEEEIVAIAPWRISETEPESTGAILLYPTSTTRALLVGVVFLGSGLPNFLMDSASSSALMDVTPQGSSHGHNMTILNRSQPFQPSPYDPAPPNIASSSRYSAGGNDNSRSRSGRSSG